MIPTTSSVLQEPGRSIREASRRKRRLHPKKWDALDVSLLMDSCLDSFAVEFCGVAFDQLTDREAKRIVGAIASHCIELGRACSPIPYRVAAKGGNQ